MKNKTSRKKFAPSSGLKKAPKVKYAQKAQSITTSSHPQCGAHPRLATKHNEKLRIALTTSIYYWFLYPKPIKIVSLRWIEENDGSTSTPTTHQSTIKIADGMRVVSFFFKTSHVCYLMYYEA